jgi:hypothetical protein
MSQRWEKLKQEMLLQKERKNFRYKLILPLKFTEVLAIILFQCTYTNASILSKILPFYVSQL